MDYNINIDTTNENIKFDKINHLSLQKMSIYYIMHWKMVGK